MMRAAVFAWAFVLTFTMLAPNAVGEDGQSCHGTTDLGHAQQGCIKSGSDTDAYFAAHSEHTYSIRPACEVGGLALCDQPGTCSIAGHDGSLFNVYEDDSPDPLDWQACLSDREAEHLGGLTPGAVQHAVERLTPAAPRLAA